MSAGTDVGDDFVAVEEAHVTVIVKDDKKNTLPVCRL